MLRLTLVLFIVGEALAEIKIHRHCPKHAALTNFNVTWFIGKWYELAKYSKDPATMSRCVTIDYKLVDDGAIEITNHQTPLKEGNPFSFTRIARPSGNSSTGRFRLSTGAPYNVLGTDYTDWAITWSCTYSEGYSTRFARILSRARYPDGPVNREAYGTAENFNLKVPDFIPAIKTGCPDDY